MLEHADGLLAEFDQGLWNAAVETLRIQDDRSMVFRWRNGMETKTIRDCELQKSNL